MIHLAVVNLAMTATDILLLVTAAKATVALTTTATGVTQVLQDMARTGKLSSIYLTDPSFF